MTGRPSSPGAYGPGKAATLPLETLSHIMTFIEDQDDLFDAMQACRMFYAAGIKPLAGMRAMSLRTKDLRSLHEFMHRYPGSFTGLHHLKLDWYHGDIPQHEADLLKDLLVGAKAHLTHLSLPSLDQFDAEGCFCQAVASLTNLKYLSAWSDSSGALRTILSQMQSPLSSIKVELYAEDHDDPTLYLANFAPTLAVLDLTGIAPSPTDVRYLQLTELWLLDGPAPALSVLMTAFPNLERVNLGDDVGRTAMIIDGHTGLETRIPNIAFQDRGHRWPSLKKLGGDVCTLYALGLQQEVDEVACNVEPICEDQQWMMSFLSPLRPQTLELALLDDKDIMALAFSEGCDNLTELYLTLYSSGRRNFAAVWVDLMKGLGCCKALRILCLKFIVKSEFAHVCRFRDKKLEATLKRLKRLGPEGLERRVMSALPHLDSELLTIIIPE